MPPKRPKPPKDSRADLEVMMFGLMDSWQMSPTDRIAYLIKFFTTADLEGICKDLSQERPLNAPPARGD